MKSDKDIVKVTVPARFSLREANAVSEVSEERDGEVVVTFPRISSLIIIFLIKFLKSQTKATKTRRQNHII